MNVCYCDWFNEEAGWSIAGQVKVRWDWQTKRECEEEEESSWEFWADAEKAGDELAILIKGTESDGIAEHR